MNSSVDSPEFDLEAALAEAEAKAAESTDKGPKISDDVLLDLAYRALEANDDLTAASTGLGSMMGRRDAVKVTVDDKNAASKVTLDVYVNVRWGVRIPDAAWDLQERMKRDLERVTGCEIKAVNIHVQGVDFSAGDGRS